MSITPDHDKALPLGGSKAANVLRSLTEKDPTP